jgi:hypothetical protein
LQIFYAIGLPGSGKTTLMQRVLAGTQRQVSAKPFAQTWHRCDDGQIIVELGRMRATGFGGTDALAMNATTRVEGWLDAMRDDVAVVVGEGDRLATDRFFSFCAEVGTLTVALVDVPSYVAATRCAARGSSQDGTWLKGRATKVSRLAKRWVQDDWVLDGTQPIDVLTAQVRQHPAFAPLQIGVQ